MKLIGHVFAVVAAIGILLSAGSASAAKDPVFTESSSSIAIRGTDPVAYFRESKPVPGSPDFAFEWNGATWHFSSQANLDAFRDDPEAYAPAYGGYCAWAVSRGYTAATDPEAWAIHDGRLFLNYSLSVQSSWSQDIPGNVERGDRNWPDVLDR